MLTTLLSGIRVVPPTIIFGMETGALSSLILFLDWLSVAAGRDSYLQVTHGRRTWGLLFVWFFGGGIVGALGAFINFYQQTPQAALLVAFTWRTFLEQGEKFLRPSREDVQRGG
jgi:hypothetical protein